MVFSTRIIQRIILSKRCQQWFLSDFNADHNNKFEVNNANKHKPYPLKHIKMRFMMTDLENFQFEFVNVLSIKRRCIVSTIKKKKTSIFMSKTSIRYIVCIHSYLYQLHTPITAILTMRHTLMFYSTKYIHMYIHTYSYTYVCI